MRLGAGEDFKIEPTWNKDQDEPHSHGCGYGHLAVCVADIEGEHGRFAAEGLSPNPVKEMQHEGAPLARFFFVEDPDGYKIEVLEQGGRYQ